jgi:DNA-binding beta-propeller fold protein YncE
MKYYLYSILCAILTLVGILDFKNDVYANEIAIVTLAGSGEVAFIDIENAKLIKTVQLDAPLPLGVAVTPDGETAIVTCALGQICFVDVAKMELKKCLKLLRGPEQIGATLIPNEFGGVDITPDSKTALVTEGNESGQLFFIDIETMELSGTKYQITVGDGPGTVIVNDIGTEAYVLDEGSTYIVNLSNRTNSLLCGPPLGNDEVDDFVLTLDESNAIYIGSDNNIYLRNKNTCVIKKAIEINDGRFREPLQVALSPDGTTAIMTSETDHSVTFFSVNIDVPPYLVVEESIDVGGGANGVAFTNDGQTAVVAVVSASLIQIIDVATRQIQATVQDDLGLAPIGVAIVNAPRKNWRTQHIVVRLLFSCLKIF